MANQRASSPGRPGRFDERTAIRDITVQQPAGEGEYIARIGGVFEQLSGRLGQLADKAAVREGTAEGAAAGMEAGLPGEGKGVFAPRRDGTLRGEAYDTAAIETYGSRVDIALRDAVSGVYDDNKDKPEAFEAALSEVKKSFLPEFASDPELLAGYTKRFEEQAFAYRHDVKQRQLQRVLEERQVALDERLVGVRQDLERRALIGGPGGDAALQRDLAAFTADLADQVSEGVLTPKQAYAYRKDIVASVAIARVRGSVSGMGPEAQIAFADNLDAAWASGDKALASLSADDVGQVAGEIRAEAGRKLARRNAGAAAGNELFKTALADDVASIEATGKPLALEGRELTIDQIASVAGSETARAHETKRAVARAYYGAVADLPLLPADKIAERLAGLTPEAGAPGYKAQAEIAEKVTTEAGRVLKARLEDPALAADALVPDGAEGEALIDARFAGQAALEIPSYVQAPLTKAEIAELTGPVEAAEGSEAEPQAITGLLTTIAERYGKHADKVMVQVLQTKGFDKEEAELAQGMWKTVIAGERVKRMDAVRASVLDGTAAASRAMAGTPDTPAAPPMKMRPPQQAIQMLKADPANAAMFDAKYGIEGGPSLAEYYLSGSAGVAP